MTNQQESKSDKATIYTVSKSTERMVVLWEHIGCEGIKRVETAIVNLDMPMVNIEHIKAAYDSHFGAGKGHSTITVKPSYVITVDNRPAESEKKP